MCGLEVKHIKTHEEGIDEACRIAEAAMDVDEVPVGCVVVREGRVLIRRHNLTNIEHDPLSHAEYAAVRDLLAEGVSLDGTTFYITIEPCVMCHGVLRRVGATVYFGCHKEIFGCRKLTGQEGGVCMDDERAVKLLRKFYTKENMSAPEEKRLSKKRRRQV